MGFFILHILYSLFPYVLPSFFLCFLVLFLQNEVHEKKIINNRKKSQTLTCKYWPVNFEHKEYYKKADS